MADNGDADKAERPAEAKPPAASGRGRSASNEWTASDRRGPLDEADDQRGRDSAPQAGPAGAPEATSAAATSEADRLPPAADVSSEGAQATSSGDPPRRHVPVLPIIAALVVGAVIGAASAAVVYKTADQGASQGDVNALASRLDALEKRPDPQPELDQLKASLDKTSQSVASAQQKPAAPAFDPGPLQQKITGLEADIDALKKQDADHSLGDKVAALGTAVAALQAQGDAIKAQGDAIKAQGEAVKAQGEAVKGLDAKVAGLATSIDGLKQEDASAKQGIATLQSGQKTLEGKTAAPALAVAADSLVSAIDEGRPYAGQVDALAGLGADPAKLAVLRENAGKGVPSARVLAAKFAPLADPITATASQAPPNAGLGDQLKAGLFGMVSVRRADATAGDDVASRVSRIEADLAHDDVAGAYQTWSGLPDAAKAKSEAWGALAKTQVTAMAAARDLQAQAIAALDGKKS